MIEVNNLTKKYGPHTAVDNISFVINDGEVVGFLGPNGAGKTTTMNMMTGFISSTSGTVRINGYDILDNPIAAKKQLGYMPDVPPLYGDMLVNEYLNFVCDLKGVKKEKREAMLEDIKKTVKIKDVEERLIKNLSKGYRQRVGLAQALVGYPDVLILDEPTVGLDPKQIIEMRDLIKKLGEKHTIIISSHILSEVSAVCNRVMIINKGKLVALEDAQSISEGGRNDKQVVTLRGDYPTAINALLGNAIIENVSMQEENREKLQATVLVEGKGDIREQIFLTLVKSGVELLMIKPATPSLEDVFMQVINGSYENKEIETRAAENIAAQTEITETAEKEEAEN